MSNLQYERLVCHMQWKKTSEGLVKFLDDKMAGRKAERRKMFGYPCYFFNGNMFIGTFQEKIILRLGDEDRKIAMDAHKDMNYFEPMPGRKMGQYVVVPKEIREDPAIFDRLLELSVKYVSSLPPKKKKGKGRSNEG